MAAHRQFFTRAVLSILLAVLLCAQSAWPARAAVSQFDLPGQAGSGAFGFTLAVLANGNIVVTDPSYSTPGAAQVGAVYLVSGASGGVISILTGSSANDRVGSGGVTALPGGNIVVSSPLWDNGTAADAGAATFGSGISGFGGANALSVVSAANSLVGSTSGDQVTSGGVVVLANGNYLVVTTGWDNSTAVDAGAVTWCSGITGCSGAISAANSLVGSQTNDFVGNGEVRALSNGNYVIGSPFWHSGTAAAAGAVTWGNGATGTVGPISDANSLVGGTANDQVGVPGVTLLANGSYVVRSLYWHSGASANVGAVTWGSGTAGVSGVVSAANSLVGSTTNDQIGFGGVFPLTNGNYVVSSPNWKNGAAVKAGAATWGSGTGGVSGLVSAANSLVGTQANDQVSNLGVTLLSNGSYVVTSTAWKNGTTAAAGAVTWGSGTAGATGEVSAANSLVGGTLLDQVGSGGITSLTNGNFVVGSPLWNNGASAADAGAVTWGSGTGGVTGVVSVGNSLVGGSAGDNVGGVTALTNGNYVVSSGHWKNGSVTNAGAVTWADGAAGISGPVSTSNSLVGSVINDYVGFNGVVALTNGNYVACSSHWRNGTAADAGAVTWASGTAGIVGEVTAANSLVGSTASDQVGSQRVVALPNGNYVVANRYWHNGGNANAGAVTWGSGTSGVSGAISESNSLVGTSASDDVGFDVTVLPSGNYVTRTPSWHSGGKANAGAVTWGSGTSGVSGAISAANSLVGSSTNDFIGSTAITVLANGNYVVRSNDWDNGAIPNVGAVTWGSGANGVSGVVSAANSLVGSQAGDVIGQEVAALPNGDYVVVSRYWSNGALAEAGAVTWGPGGAGVSGAVSGANCVLGITANGGLQINFVYSAGFNYLVVGRPADNIVTFFGGHFSLSYVPVIIK